MNDILHAFDPDDITARIEANINVYLLSFACLPGALLQDDLRIVWVDSGIADAAFNSVVYANLSRETADAQIESVLSHFQQHRRPFTWHIGPSTRPTELDALLLAHGMVHSEDEPGMAVEIDNMRSNFSAPSGLQIEEITDIEGLEEWVGVWLFGVPAAARCVYLQALHLRGIGKEVPWRYYLGRLDGAPVATSELFLGAGVAGVQYVVTLPAVRRQGIGTAMTLRVLHEARAMDYRVGVLTASQEGLGSYRRIGFRDYGWFRRYESRSVDTSDS